MLLCDVSQLLFNTCDLSVLRACNLLNGRMNNGKRKKETEKENITVTTLGLLPFSTHSNTHHSLDETHFQVPSQCILTF